MNKLIANIPNYHLILVRKKLCDGTCAALLLMRGPVRHVSDKKHFDPEKCPPASKSKRSYKLLYGAFAATLLGAGVVYAKHSPETRNFLATNAPWANHFVAVVYQEEETHFQFFSRQVGKATGAVRTFVFGKDGVTPIQFQQRSEQDLEADAQKAFSNREYKLPLTTLEPLYREDKVLGTPEVEHEATMIQTGECEPQEPLKVKITKDILELEQSMHENTKIAMDEYGKALKKCEAYNKVLYQIVELPIDALSMKKFNDLKGNRLERDKAISAAKVASSKARCALETLDRMIASNDVAAPPENIYPTKRYIKQFRADLTKAEEDMQKCMEKAVISDQYWDKVEEARSMYSEQLKALFPNLDLGARTLDVTSETDLLLLYTMKQIQFLQNELANLQTVQNHKLNKALECRDDKALIEAKADEMISKERFEKEVEYQKKLVKLMAEAQQKTKADLRKQFETQEAVTKARLSKLEQDLQAKFNRRVSELVEKERVQYKKELAAMSGKLQAIENTLKKRQAAEAEARRSQSLWAAAESLMAKLRRPDCLVKVDNELKALEKAGQNDKLVKTVLDGIPKEVHEDGVFTEKCLKEKFDALEQTAMKTALVSREGASLPVYFLSWLQSKLLFQKLAEIPQSELNNHPTDFSKLDTFDIMQRARYHMEHGDFPSAVKYVNLLQGAPRAAALCWSDAARRHLEVRQAAETVMAHASLASMTMNKK